MTNIFKLDRPTLVVFEGRDRNKVLNNLTTQDFRELKSGQASETFVTDPKGKSFGHGIAFACGEQAFFVTVADQASKLVSHFDRFIIMEDASVRDVSADFDCWIVRDPAPLLATSAWATLAQGSDIAPPHQSLPELYTAQSIPNKPQPSGHETASSPLPLPAGVFRFASPTDGKELFAVAAPWISPNSLLLITAAGQIPSEWVAILERCSSWDLERRSDWEQERIAANWPWYGLDFDEKNLPQEIDRDHTAISFNKGCYLGQETIARLDALGQVQKKLVRLELRSLPHQDPANTEPLAIQAEELEVGSVRSFAPFPAPDSSGSDSAKHERDSAGIAFGFVKRSHFAPGTSLTVGAERVQATVMG